MSDLNGRYEDFSPVTSFSVDDHKDQVNPSHYEQGDMGFYEAVMAMMGDRVLPVKVTTPMFNIFRYVFRHDLKAESNEDILVNLEKAQWYLDKLKSVYSEDDGV
tara:strand:+ start:521 stop:832 length:312 start_codon:yes stop_codon:yes gene_type:complete